ncbi:MAG: TerC family protein [Armatimonadetes bacterium]|nr:TerC family protein [Armatimonadota bacterium]
MGSVPLWAWVGFNLFVLALLALDLGVFHRKAHAVSLREAAAWSGVWMALGLSFGVGVFLWMGREPGLAYFTGYLIEKSLSIDNIFVFALLFSYFAVPAEHQHRVLFWGIIGALIMRGALILVGAALLAHFHWVVYLFGGFLVLTGLKMLRHRGIEVDPGRSPVVSLFRRTVPSIPEYEGDRFFVIREGRRLATPLLLVLLTVETTDLVFAVDSIPAIFAVTDNPFIVYTSNVFAILGLRSLYFLLAGSMDLFRYLKAGLAAVLCFVGVKMVLASVVKIPTGLSLLVVGALLAAAIGASVLANRREVRAAAGDAPGSRLAARGD